MAAAVCGPGSLGAGPASAPESRVKAAFVYNFAKFTAWPTDAFAESDDTFDICVLGQDSVGEALGAFHGRPVGQRRAYVRPVTSTAGLMGCHILYVCGDELMLPADLAEVLVRAGARHALTVSERAGFLDAGGVIALHTSGRKLRFAVNLDAADRAQLKLSSKLLRLSGVVAGKTTGTAK